MFSSTFCNKVCIGNWAECELQSSMALFGLIHLQYWSQESAYSVKLLNPTSLPRYQNMNPRLCYRVTKLVTIMQIYSFSDLFSLWYKQVYHHQRWTSIKHILSFPHTINKGTHSISPVAMFWCHCWTERVTPSVCHKYKLVPTGPIE